MIEQSLYDYFTTHHYPREEVLNRLPFSVSMDEFWPRLLQLRKARAVTLPLTGQGKEPLWFVMTDSIIASGDRIASMSRRDLDRIDPCEDLMTDGLMDEAFFTSFVEGAPISRLECRRFLKSGEDPSNVRELLAQNNLSAIRHMAEQRYEPHSSRMLLTWARLLTNAMDGEVEDYRVSNTHTIPGRALAHQAVPPAEDIPGMMDDLCLFLNEYEMHPLLKAAIAQACILLARPYDEGNERLARLLSYSILLRNGYSFFRQFALSGMIAQDGMLYYQAMKGIQDSRGGSDLTCFLEYYLGMLSRSVSGFEAYLAQRHKQDKVQGAADQAAGAPGPPDESHGKETQPIIPQLNPADAGAEKMNKERERRLNACDTPEALVSFVIRWQSSQLKIFDARPYLSKLGLKSPEVLEALRRKDSENARAAVIVWHYLQNNPSRTFSCTELSNALKIANCTTRRLCYALATLNLIRFSLGSGGDEKRPILSFYCEDRLAA